MTLPENTILDRSALEELREDLEEAFTEFVYSFLRNARQGLADMDSALAGGDTTTAGHQAHALKGTAGYLGAQRLMAQMEELQHLAPAGAAAAMASVLAAARRDFEILDGQLREIIGAG